LEVNAEKKVWKTDFGLNSFKYPRKLEFWVLKGLGRTLLGPFQTYFRQPLGLFSKTLSYVKL